MDAQERQRWSAVKSLLVIFAKALESWFFSQGQHGIFAKITEANGILTGNTGHGESTLFASTNDRVGESGEEGRVCCFFRVHSIRSAVPQLGWTS